MGTVPRAQAGAHVSGATAPPPSKVDLVQLCWTVLRIGKKLAGWSLSYPSRGIFILPLGKEQIIKGRGLVIESS